jgi:transcriptional antiterminator
MNDKGDEITEEEVKAPLGELVINNKKQVKIKDMADYYDVFFAIENTTFHYWIGNPDLNDRKVINAFNHLLRDFDNQKEGGLASEISKSVKAILIWRKRNKDRDYTLGELTSCISLLIKLANEHKSSGGRGYLKWIRAFFEGRMPESEEEIMKYILQNEI